MALRYRTNGPEFDFPPFTGLPPVRYVLASTPRCGSNMLARALWHTGLAGFAEDYFADAFVLDYFERWGFDSDDPQELAEGYVRRLMACRTSPNGVFGLRIHAGHLGRLEADPYDILQAPRYIWIQRGDRLRQAVSYAMAEQTGVWILDGTYLPEPEGSARVAPRYGYDDIRRHLRLLDRDTAAWEDYFDRHGVVPHVVVYEDLVARYEEGLRGCLDFLGVDAPASVPAPGIRRQADELTQQWVERFLRDRRAERPAA
ncbi:Stf0 family sulfotransferase [Streptomyces sp. NPDC005648]|uniref:Stf0 family sulfotransferase n=1 Tax=Streptomyces sp. NPDC005648 TaxID=3157044 RepID=UPI0033AA0455